MADYANVSEYFNQLQGKLNANGKLAGLTATYLFNITGDDGGVWHVAITDGAGAVGEGESEKSDTTLTVSSADWLQIVTGKLNPQMAFMSGKIKIKGNMSLAMKLGSFLG